MRKLLVLSLLVIFLIAACQAEQPPKQKADEEFAPDFTYHDLRGEPWSLAALRDDVVVLYFWTASCGVCVHKLAELPALQENLPAGVHLLLLNANDSVQVVRDLIGDAALTVLIDAIKSFRDYQVAYVPTTVFVGRSGKVEHFNVGLMANEDIIRIAENLKSSGP